MSVQNLTISSPVVYTLMEYLANCGVSIESGSDFFVYEKLLKDQPERGPIGPRFRPEALHPRKDKSFWIIGRNPFGEIVHTQAIRIVDLKGQNLALHMENHIGDYISEIFDHDKLRYCPGPGARSIKGTVCYAGEFWMSRGDSGIRGMDLSTPLFRLTLAMSLLKWSPDFIFAIMRTAVVSKGLAARANFLHTEPSSFMLPFVDRNEEVEAWTTWVSREDIQHLMKLTLNKRVPFPGKSRNSDLKRKVA